MYSMLASCRSRRKATKGMALLGEQADAEEDVFGLSERHCWESRIMEEVGPSQHRRAQHSRTSFLDR